MSIRKSRRPWLKSGKPKVTPSHQDGEIRFFDRFARDEAGLWKKNFEKDTLKYKFDGDMLHIQKLKKNQLLDQVLKLHYKPSQIDNI